VTTVGTIRLYIDFSAYAVQDICVYFGQTRQAENPRLGMGSLLHHFRCWLHAGEDGAIVIYNKRYRLKLFLTCCILGAAWMLFPEMRERRGPLILLGLTAFWLPRMLAEGRRAIVFTNMELVYRPPVGGPVRASIAGIQGIKRSQVARLVGYQRLSSTQGMLLTMANGETIAMPLDFKERAEILQRLTVVTGKTISE